MFSDIQKQEITDLLQSMLEQPVNIILFTQDEPSMELPVQVEVTPCEYCEETEQMLRELTELSDKLSLVVYDFVKDNDKAQEYGIKDVPATVIAGDKDYGIRYYGVPSGYEFSALLDALMHVSRRKTRLSEDTRRMLAEIDKPITMQVFVTPT
jgi:glutaredoxin-like protein